MNWLRKIFTEIVTMCFMMVGISPPEPAKENTNQKKDVSDASKGSS
ncbi:MAG: hypothetical protein ACREBD_19305 [Blastocatellia bacterium]